MKGIHKWFDLLGLLGLPLLLGCQHGYYYPVQPASIPEMEYKVTVYDGGPPYYAVLFEIPDDRWEVGMYHSDLSRSMGMDWPDAYLKRFKDRVRFYSIYAISNKEGGPARGYLAKSNLLDFLVSEDPVRHRIMIRILSPVEEGRGAGTGGAVLRHPR